jgi:hypothetical protein
MKLTLTVACTLLQSAWQAVCRSILNQLHRLSPLCSGLLRSALTALLLAPLAEPSDAADPAISAKGKLHVYLLIGQSNMAGRGQVGKEPAPVHPRVLMFTKQNQWAPAVEPLHFDGKGLAGAGLGMSFARAMAEAHPEATIGVVPCAVGGTPLSRWQKGGDLYQQSVVRLQAALKDGVLRGVLWHQGESDAGDPKLAATYATRLAGMIADLRADLAAPELPFVAGKLGEFSLAEKKGKPYLWKTVNEQLAGLPGLSAKVAVVESTGLTHKGDFVHFDTPALRTLGQRYATAMLALQSGAPLPAKTAAETLLPLTPESASQLDRAQKAGLIEVAPVHLPLSDAGPCNHYGWPIATMTGDTLVVMHRRIPGHNPVGAGKPDPMMSYGIVLRSDDGGKTWSEPYDLRDCTKPEDRTRGGLVPLSHRYKWDPQNKSTEGYKVHLHSIGTTRDGAVVAINNHGVFRSDDAGLTWKHFSTALREDTFPHEVVNLGPNIIDHPQQGLLAFGNWHGRHQRFVVLRSADGGANWQVEEHPPGFPQYEPASLLREGRLLFVTRDQTVVPDSKSTKQDLEAAAAARKRGVMAGHKQMSWLPGQVPQVIDTNLEDPRGLDTVDFSFNPLTKRFEVVRSERYRMELWLWSMDPADWDKGQWKRECRLVATEGAFYRPADGFHPAGAVIDEKRGVQHLFIYSGHANGPAGVFRITRTLDTTKLSAALGNK